MCSAWEIACALDTGKEMRSRTSAKEAGETSHTSRTTRLIVKVKVIFGPRRLLLIVSTFDIYSMSMRSL